MHVGTQASQLLLVQLSDGHPFIHPFIHPCTGTHSIHSFIHPCTHSHPFIHPCMHPFPFPSMGLRWRYENGTAFLVRGRSGGSSDLTQLPAGLSLYGSTNLRVDSVPQHLGRTYVCSAMDGGSSVSASTTIVQAREYLYMHTYVCAVGLTFIQKSIMEAKRSQKKLNHRLRI